MSVGELIAIAGVAGLGLYLWSQRKSAAAAPPPASAPGALGGLSSNSYVAAGQILFRSITNPNSVNHAIFGVGTDTFTQFGDRSDFDELMVNAHACQTGNQAACEAVWEQAPGMACTPQFCDQDPAKNNGHGSAVDNGNGVVSYNQPGGIRATAHYGKKVPVGGCFTSGRRWDTGGAANAQDNISHGSCTGLPTAATVLA